MTRRLQELPVKMPYRGKIVSLPDSVLPRQALEEMYNFTYDRQKTAGLMPGWKIFDATGLGGPVMLLDQFFKADGSSFFIGITTSKLKEFDTTSGLWVDKAGALTGDYTNVISADVWSDPGSEMYIFTNGKDAVKKYTGTGNVAALGGMSDAEPGSVVINTAKCVRNFKDFVVLVHTTEDGNPKPYRIRWGKKGYPEIWKNDANGLGEAGYTDLKETTDWLLSAERLGDYMIVYKERSIYSMEYVGSPTVMRLQRIIDGVGILGQRSVVSMGDYHFIAGSDDFYELTQSSFEPIGDDIKDEFFSLLNPNRKDQVMLFVAEEYDEVIVAFPSTASDRPDKFYVYNFAQKNWSGPHDRNCTTFGYYQALNSMNFDDLAGAWSIQSGFWDDRVFQTNSPLNMIGDNSGYVYQLYDGITANGTAINGHLQFGLDDLETPNNMKRLQKIWATVNSASAGVIRLYIGYTDNIDNPVSWAGPYEKDLKENRLEFDCNLTAKYFQLKFETVDGTPFRLVGHSFGYYPMEARR